MPRAGLSRDAVADAALALVDAEGPAALTLAAVAARTGVATPSLYKHVGSLTDLRNLLAVRLFDEFTAATTAAVLGHSGDAALERLMRAYHRYAVTHPHRYALLPQTPDPDPAVAAAADRFIEVCFAVVAGCGLRDDEIIHATRITRAAMHGFAVLHTSGGFGLPQDVDTTFDRLVTTVVRGVTTTGHGPGQS